MNRINIGCGRTPTKGWINLDNTPALKLAKFPVFVSLLRKFALLEAAQLQNIEWNRLNSVGFCDATAPLPFEDSSIDVVYTSHMVEHLSRTGAVTFFGGALRILRSGGVLRVSVPNLRLLVDEYLVSGDADEFIRRAYVSAGDLNSVRDKLKLLAVGFRHHQWMYDGDSLSAMLREVGFSKVFILGPGETRIDEPGDLNLYERQEESVFVEAIK